MIRIPTHRPPTHPGEMLLDEFLTPMGLTQRELANAPATKGLPAYSICRRYRNERHCAAANSDRGGRKSRVFRAVICGECESIDAGVTGVRKVGCYGIVEPHCSVRRLRKDPCFGSRAGDRQNHDDRLVDRGVRADWFGSGSCAGI